MNPQPNVSSDRHNQAIVIGGSIAGLLTARVLTHHFDRITIIERDRLPQDPSHRPGVPQSYHLHVLLDRGRRILEELFPGFQDEMVAAGAHPLDMSADIPWLTPFGWSVRFRCDLTLLSGSRVLLENRIRQRLKAFPQIEFLQEAEVKALLPHPKQLGVAGILVRTRGEEKPLLADLVIDASGRASKAPQWLEKLGYVPPQETIVNAHIGYASRLYEGPAGGSTSWRGLVIQATPPTQPRGGILFPIEGDRWLVTLAAGDKDYPPGDEAGFLDFIRSLPTSLLYETLKEAEPRSPIYCYRGTQNRLRHYERLSELPDGFAAIGDSVCAFNPIYGQGISAAAVGVLLLDRCLQEHFQRFPNPSLRGFSLSFQKQLAKINAPLWELATIEDCRYRTVTGISPNSGMWLMHRYMDRVVALTAESRFPRQTLLGVFNLLNPPSSLFHPRLVLQVLRQIFRLQDVSSGNASAMKEIDEKNAEVRFERG